MNKHLQTTLLLTFVVLLTTVSCQKGEQDAHTAAAELDESSTTIVLTQEQIQSGRITIGQPTLQPFPKEISCRGALTAPAHARAEVSTPIAGAVERVHFTPGDYVRRGQTLCTISGSEFLSLQQQYAESAALFARAKADHERMKLLQQERIGAQKDYIAAESNYKAALASYNALKARIHSLNIDPERIESGSAYTHFPVVAPISGYITDSHAVVGQYIEPAFSIAEIVDIDQLHLRLSVLAQDITRVRAGQEVRFGPGGGQEPSMSATVRTVGKSVNPETKTIDCFAELNHHHKQYLVYDTYVEANIIISSKEALALPVSAVRKEGSNYYVYLVEDENETGYTLTRRTVEVGSISRDYYELISGLSIDSRLLTGGIDTL